MSEVNTGLVNQMLKLYLLYIYIYTQCHLNMSVSHQGPCPLVDVSVCVPSVCLSFCSTLSSCIHAVVALLYPFSWQHTFIPVLPASMLDIVCCPTPFLVGLLSSSLPRLKDLPVEEVGLRIVWPSLFLSIYLSLSLSLSLSPSLACSPF